MIFKTFQQSDVVAGRIQTVTTGIWTDSSPVLNSFHTSSNQVQITGSTAFEIKNGLYYWDVYNKNPQEDATAEVQFSVTYGQRYGSGSLTDLNSGSVLPTQAIYSQYKNILLNPSDTVFTFAISGSTLSGYDSDDIYVLNFASSRFKEKIDAGRIELTLAGSNGTFTFIDDSILSAATVGRSGRVYNIISGSLISGSADQYDSLGRGFGLLYPDVGVMLLNPKAVASVVGTELSASWTTSEYAVNHSKLFSDIKLGAKCQARSVEYIPNRNYFVRVGNQEYNYSNNPSFIINDIGSVDYGKLRFPEFANDPKVYITTVGLYNENNDLVAVAKLSQPLQKTFDSEALLKIALRF
jgi:hypothetical protein